MRLCHGSGAGIAKRRRVESIGFSDHGVSACVREGACAPTFGPLIGQLVDQLVGRLAG